MILTKVPSLWALVYSAYLVTKGLSSSPNPGCQRPSLSPLDKSAFSALGTECGINLRKASVCSHISFVYYTVRAGAEWLCH